MKIIISKDTFDWLKKYVLEDDIKEKCDCCKVKITRDNFGYLKKDRTLCNNPSCLSILVLPENEDFVR